MAKFFSTGIICFLLCQCISGAVSGDSLVSADSLTVSPARPKATDPVQLTIIFPNWDCCTRFDWDSTRVTMMGDTGIMLSYMYDPFPQVCGDIYCQNVPFLLRYKCGYLPAGTYAVWEAKQMTCPNCRTRPVVQKLGTFTVSGSTSVSRSVPAPVKLSVLNENERTYDLRGALVSSRNSRTPKHLPGVFFVKKGKNLVKQAY